MTQLAEAQRLADRLARVLRDEIAAIARGALAEVPALAAEKEVLLAEIEDRFSGDLSHLEGGDRVATERLRTRLAEVQDLVRRDLALLERMTEATGMIAAEIARIRDRNGLAGLYGPDGELSTMPVAGSQRLDRTL